MFLFPHEPTSVVTEMINRWNENDAAACVTNYGARGVPDVLALRVYTSRLIGADPALVLHGGGNTSAKGEARDVFGDVVPVVYVKGSGWDLAAIEPAGFPAVRLDQARRMRALENLGDDAMMNALRTMLLDASAPNPSVEALLHAFLPHTFVDHTHADAILVLADQPNAEALCRDIFGDRIAILPYVFPGFPLAGAAINLFEANPTVEGLLLLNHGLFTFGATARESYDRMIHWVQVAEDAIAARATSPRITAARIDQPAADQVALAAPIVRGALAIADESAPGGHNRMLLHFRTSDAIRSFTAHDRLEEVALQGTATPDHVIRTKRLPLVLPALNPGDPGAYALECRRRVAAYAIEYEAYFNAGLNHTGLDKVMLDPLPRILLWPRVGFFAAGATDKDARIAADIYEHTIEIIAAAESLGRFSPLSAMELFEMEYWSLEQAKLGKAKEKPFARHVVLVTGAASGIGAATAQAFAAEGAHIVLLDVQADALRLVAEHVRKRGGAALDVACDVTSAEAVRGAFAQAIGHFGGIDIVVSNAGSIWQGNMAEAHEADLRSSFELNFFAHQHVAAEAVRVFDRQGTGGQLLFNASKSTFNPGPKMGPYTLPKAAVVALMKQYAVEYGAIGVRSNAINADRVPTALFGEGVLEKRAKARGLSPDEYLSANLLKRIVRAEDVAQAFVALAKAERTTGAVLPVDGGNIAAAPR